MLVLGLRLLPRRRAVWRVYAATGAFAALAAIGCLATGGNYMFLRDKPSNGSILDPFGPWPWYLLAAAALGLAMLLVLEAIARGLRPRGGATRGGGGRAVSRAGAAPPRSSPRHERDPRSSAPPPLRAAPRAAVAPALAAPRRCAGCCSPCVAFVALLGVEALIAIQTVPDDDYRRPPPRHARSPPAARPARRAGRAARALRFVVLGDSTATGRGAPYERGIAVAAARHLARVARRVTLRNLAVSGARFGDVRREQLTAAAYRAPDVVLIAAGANDVTGLTRLGSVRKDLERSPTGCATPAATSRSSSPARRDVGAAPRLAQPLRTVAGWRTKQVNGAIEDVARERGLVFAPIAERTGRRFRADRSLFAADGFHPSAAGYGDLAPRDRGSTRSTPWRVAGTRPARVLVSGDRCGSPPNSLRSRACRARIAQPPRRRPCR